MGFPQTNRVVYENNPLVEVLCQIRFPVILKIDVETPAIFQDNIRNIFPLYEERNEKTITIKSNQPFKNIPVISGPSEIIKNYQFVSEDKKCIVNLTRTYIAIKTYSYKRWEDYKEIIKSVLNIFFDIYKPVFYTRIGLKYTDIIDKAELKLDDNHWFSLLNPYLIGTLSDGSKIHNDIISHDYSFTMNLEQPFSFANIRSSFIINGTTQKQCMLLESDFYIKQKISPDKLLEKLDFLNNNSSRFIRWAISEQLHNAMIPKNIE